jgi:hypothetical protein
MRVVLTFTIRHYDRPLALPRAIGKALRTSLTRTEATRCQRAEGAWIVDVADYVREAGGCPPSGSRPVVTLWRRRRSKIWL